MTRYLLIAACALGGCASTSQIGPYVKSVTRQGPWLTVQKCMIVLDGEELQEGACTTEQLPLYTLAPPIAAPPQGGYAPQAPGLPKAPTMPSLPSAPSLPSLPHR